MCNYKYTAFRSFVKKCLRLPEHYKAEKRHSKPMPVRHDGIIHFTGAADLSLHLTGNSERLSEDRRVTRRASSTKSATRNNARPCPMRTSGSGAAMSVHCGGTEQIVLSSTRSKSRLPDRLWRSPTQTNCWPANGWKGWVMRTRCVETAGTSAFPGELQAARTRPVHLAEHDGHGPDRALRGAVGGATGWLRVARAGAPPRAGTGGIRNWRDKQPRDSEKALVTTRTC